jgi:hypothetical protein
MPQLSKKEFAELVRSMPGASEDDIIAAAKQREAESYAPETPEEPSTLRKAWDFARTPLTTAPSDAARVGADAIDQRSLDDNEPIAGFIPKGMLKGFAAGALQGAGDLVSAMTSPLDLALTLTGFGGAAAGRRGALGISQAARNIEKGLMVPLAGEGAVNAAQGVAEGDWARAGMGAMQAAGAGVGIKTAGTHAFPPEKVRAAYMKSKGRLNVPTSRVEKLDPEFSKQTADAYEAMEHNPQDPAVAAAYQAMADETSDQFAFLRDQAGVKMEPWTSEGQPYANSAEMMADVTNNNRLFYFPSEAGFGMDAAAAGNPLLKAGKSGSPVNDEFRAAHDYFGHAVEGNQFGPLGEERAYQAHRSMFPAEAVPALTTETRGQNSWVNFGRHLRKEDGSLPKKGEAGFVAPQDRPFAEQKTGLLPEQFQRAEPSASGPTPVSRATGTGAPSPSQPAYGLDDAAVNVAKLTAEHGGSTFNLHKGSLSGTPHYAVSVFPERGVIIDGPASPEAIASFVQKNADLLQDPDNSIGTWFNNEDGKTYLDISVTKESLDDALRLGQEKNQLAIFDLNKFEEIKVPQSGRPGAAPAVAQMEGAPAEFHAVEPRTGEPAQGLPKRESEAPLQMPTRSAVDKQKADLDAFRANAAKERGEQPLPRTGTGGSTALAVGAPAAAMAIPDDPDSEWDDWARIALMGTGAVGLGAAGHFPKGLKKELDALVAQSKAAGMKEAQVETALFNHLREKFKQPNGPADPAKVNHAYGTYRTIPLPKVDGINFDKRFPVTKLVKLGKDKSPEFSPVARERLLKAYEVGSQKGSEWGTTEHLGRLTNNDPEAAMQIARMWGAFSPGTATGPNTLQGIEGFIRAIMRGEHPRDFISKMNTVNARRPGAVRNNVERIQQGGRIYQKKTEALAAGEVGLNDLPIDLWFLRAMGANFEKSPPTGVYEAIKNSAAKLAAETGEELFPFMAKVWTGMQHIAGSPSPSFSRSVKEAGVPANINHPEVADWFLQNSKGMVAKLGGGGGGRAMGKSAREVPFKSDPPEVHGPPRYSDEEFKLRLQKLFAETRAKGDVLGKNRVTKGQQQADLQLVEQVLGLIRQAGIDAPPANVVPFQPPRKPKVKVEDNLPSISTGVRFLSR